MSRRRRFRTTGHRRDYNPGYIVRFTMPEYELRRDGGMEGHMKYAMIAISLVLLGGTLSACGPRGCPKDRGASAMNLNSLESAALYNRNPRPLRPDIWTENPGLELFLRETIASNGISSLAKYGMECAPAPPEIGCKDCFSCTKT